MESDLSPSLSLEIIPELSDATLVLAFDGWNDAGESATGALRFLNEGIQSAPLGEIDAEAFFDFTVRRPEVRIDGEGARQLEWPSVKLRYGTIGEAALVTGLGSEPHLHWKAFVREVEALIRVLRVRRVVLLGAFLADVLYTRPLKVSGFGPPERLAELGVSPTDYQGPTGIVGVLGAELPKLGVEVTSLWAGLPHYITLSPNPRGMLALLHKLSGCLDLPLDHSPLEREAAEFEEQVSKLVAADPELTAYVRELKRREFSQ
jgi:hypothetical protein